MTDNNLNTSRRSTLKLLSGSAVGAAGVGTATATDDGGTGQDGDLEETTDWVLRLEDSPVDSSIETADEAALRVEETQQPVLEELQELDGVTVKGQFWIANAILVQDEASPEAARQRLSSLSNVREVHENFEVESPEPVEEQELVGESHGDYTYGLEQINVPEVWEEFGTTGEGVSLAVLDTGIDPDHPDLEFDEENWAFFGPNGEEIDEPPFDNDDHGTHVSGTAAGGQASGLNGQHFGVAPGVELYNGKVLNDGGTFTQIIAGIQWAVGNGVDVVNMSLGATGYFGQMIEPIQNATAMGTLIVSSAGNSGQGSSGTPGNVVESFSIGAANEARGIAGFSSGELIRTDEAWSADWLTGDWPINYYVPDVSAPGVDVVSSVAGGSYSAFSGTSMASPHTAGAAAMLLSIEPSLSIQEVRDLLGQTARHGDPDTEQGDRYGRGIIDLLAAATAATDGNVVEGTVTDSNGNPVGGVTVTSSFGTEATTGDDGSFRIFLGDGEHELSATTLGFSTDSATVSVSGGDTTTQNFSLSSKVDVVPLDLQPGFVGQGDSFDIVVSATNLETLTVNLSSDSGLSAGDLSLSLGETEIPLGETLELGGFEGQAAITVSVASDAALADFSLEHEFGGPGEPVNVTTGPTTVVENSPALEIVDWSSNTEVEMGPPLQVSATVENTGDGVASGAVSWFLGSPNGANVFTAGTAKLESGEQTTIPFSIGIPADLFPPGAQAPHGFVTEDDVVQTTATFAGPIFAITGVDAPRLVDRGETLEVDVSVQNLGNLEGSGTIEYSFDGVLAGSQLVSAPVEGTDSVTVQFDTTRVVSGSYQHSISSLIGTTEYDAAGPLPITVGQPDSPIAIVGDSPPTDPDGDGTYEDLDGDGQVTLNDVQVFSQNLNSDAIQEFPEFYDFTGDGQVTISDVRALFEQV